MVCRKCNKEVSDTSTFCKHCGVLLKEDKKICKVCKKEIDKDSSFCEFCGADLADIRKINVSSMGSLFTIEVDLNKGCTYKDILNAIIAKHEHYNNENVINTAMIFDYDGKGFFEDWSEKLGKGEFSQEEAVNILAENKDKFICRVNFLNDERISLNDDDVSHLLEEDFISLYFIYNDEE